MIGVLTIVSRYSQQSFRIDFHRRYLPRPGYKLRNINLDLGESLFNTSVLPCVSEPSARYRYRRKNSYGVTVGSFLLLWGKVSDLYSAKPVFTIGFLVCGGISIVISFMTDQYAFYVFRALYGISAAATVSFRFHIGGFPCPAMSPISHLSDRVGHNRILSFCQCPRVLPRRNG